MNDMFKCNLCGSEVRKTKEGLFCSKPSCKLNKCFYTETEWQLLNTAHPDYEQQISTLTRDKAVLERALRNTICNKCVNKKDNCDKCITKNLVYATYLVQAEDEIKSEQEHDPH